MRKATLGLALLWALGAQAAQARSQDISCQTLVRLENGFTYRPQPGLSVLRLARTEGPFVYEHGGDVLGFICLRTEMLPEAEADLEVLRAGFTLDVGNGDRGLRLLHLAIEEGQLVARMNVGALDAGEQRRLDAIVDRMRTLLGRPSR